jgi:hypothetical protein
MDGVSPSQKSIRVADMATLPNENCANLCVSTGTYWRKKFFLGTRKPINWLETGLARSQLELNKDGISAVIG